MLTLSKDMETGVVKIDEQHRELINRLNAVTSMGLKSISKEETQKTISILEEYIVKHFSDEEALHKQSNYPKRDEHKQMHKQYISEFRTLKREFITNGESPKFTMTLNNSIINWIVKHIKTADAEFGKFYTAKK
ncbi:MAG: hemerythrin family protein [Oscillospiraceae bacterium]|nr:hemerythrin family protein [Oscillospiraceae bacterium]